MIKKINLKKSTYITSVIWILFWAIYIFVISYAVNQKKLIFIKNENYGLVEMCLSDIIGISFNSTRPMMMFSIMFILINKLKQQFRSSVMILRKSRFEILLKMYKQVIKSAGILTLLATIITIIIGLIYADSYTCNWNSNQSYMRAYYGMSNLNQIFPTWAMIVIYICTLFIILFVVGIILILSWYFVNPIIGCVGILIIYMLETASQPPIYTIFFNFVRPDIKLIYFYGFDIRKIIIPTLIISVTVMIINILIIKKKNLFY